ncbi:MAG: hypothetical protein QOD93_5494 [Acetobacteraceae bacterium]|nr:hypothetical protein [Acetobacteraceae bacterium]
MTTVMTDAWPLHSLLCGWALTAIRHKPGKPCSLRPVRGTRAGLVGKPYPVRIER